MGAQKGTDEQKEAIGGSKWQGASIPREGYKLKERNLFLACSGLSFPNEARGRHGCVRRAGLLIQDLSDLV